jgi:hypothetical protein
MSSLRFPLLLPLRQLTRSALRVPAARKIWQEQPVDGTVSAWTDARRRASRSAKRSGVIMSRQICILLMLAVTYAEPAAGAAEPPPEPGRCPYAIKPLPRNVTRAVDRIVADMYPEFRDKLLTTKREDLPQFQDWGKGIRTQLCLEAGGNDQLMRSACKGELCHPETASAVIMEAVWERLQSVKKVLRPGQPIPKFAPAS